MSTDMITIPGSNIEAISGAKKLGPSDPSEKVSLSIYVRRNPHGTAIGQQRLRNLTEALPGERRYLNTDEFNKIYGADSADLEVIVKWASSNRLNVITSSVPMRRVTAEGTIADVQDAFGVELNEYEHPVFGRFRGREGSIHIDPQLGGIIKGVFGLDTRPLGKPYRRRANRLAVPYSGANARVGPTVRSSLPNLTNQFPGAFFPPQVATLYSYPTQLDGTGQNVAIFAFNGPPSPDPRGGYSLPALQNYYEQVLGGKTPEIKNVVVQGPGNDPGPDSPASENRGDSTGEVMLDMCVVGSVAPGANIFMYFTEFNAKGWVDAIHQAITDENDISIISISYGNPENGNSLWTAMGVQAVNAAFEAAAAKGITICCASGDDGSSDGPGMVSPHVDFPASSPFVLSVGGTKLVAAPGYPPAIIAREIVWNETASQEGAGGGGVSVVFAKPPYQNAAGVPRSVVPPHFIGRGVPDVAADADPVTGVIVMHIDGKNLEQIGGTSASTPLWAALVACMNQGLQAKCGFLNTVLYTKCPKGVLRDIRVGNNGAYAAKIGWDACTGLGTPNGQKLLAALSGSAPGSGNSSSIVRSTSGQAARQLRSVIRPKRVAALLSAVKYPARVARILNQMSRPKRVARILHAMRVGRAARVLKAIRTQRPRRFQLIIEQMREIRPVRTQQILGRMGPKLLGRLDRMHR